MAAFKRGDIVKVGRGETHGEFVAIVDHINPIGQPYVIAIDRSSISPKYLCGQSIVVLPEDRWTDDQFASYARWRDANGLRVSDAAEPSPAIANQEPKPYPNSNGDSGIDF